MLRTPIRIRICLYLLSRKKKQNKCADGVWSTCGARKIKWNRTRKQQQQQQRQVNNSNTFITTCSSTAAIRINKNVHFSPYLWLLLLPFINRHFMCAVAGPAFQWTESLKIKCSNLFRPAHSAHANLNDKILRGVPPPSTQKIYSALFRFVLLHGLNEVWEWICLYIFFLLPLSHR